MKLNVKFKRVAFHLKIFNEESSNKTTLLTGYVSISTGSGLIILAPEAESFLI